jgi:copper chaperone CopZ
MNCRLFSILASFSICTLLCAGSALACGMDDAEASQQAPAAEPEAPAQAPEKQPRTVEFTTLRVDGVTCGNCLIPIRKELKALKGVKGIESGRDLKDVIVSYAPGTVSAEQLVAAIKKAGYEAVVKGAAPPAKT